MIRGREEAEGQSKLEGWAENIDLQGAAWTVFAKEAGEFGEREDDSRTVE